MSARIALAKIAAGLAEIAAGLATLAASTQQQLPTVSMPLARMEFRPTDLTPPTAGSPTLEKVQAECLQTIANGGSTASSPAAEKAPEAPARTRKPREPKADTTAVAASTPETSSVVPGETTVGPTQTQPVKAAPVSAAVLRDMCRKASAKFGIAKINECLGGVNVVDMTEEQRAAAAAAIATLIASVVE